jgi:hypothetical protein
MDRPVKTGISQKVIYYAYGAAYQEKTNKQIKLGYRQFIFKPVHR